MDDGDGRRLEPRWCRCRSRMLWMVRFRIPVEIVALAATAVGLLLAAPTDAWAYIDPGSGSMAYQVLLAGALAAGFLFRRLWARVKTWFGSRGMPRPPVNNDRDVS